MQRLVRFSAMELGLMDRIAAIFASLLAGSVLAMPSSGSEIPFDDAAAAGLFDYCGWVASSTEAVQDETDQEARFAQEHGNEQEIAAAAIVAASLQLAREADTVNDCLEVLRRGHEIFNAVLIANENALRRQGRYKKSRNKEYRAVQELVTTMWRRDQAARATYVSLQTDGRDGPRYLARQLSAAHAVVVDAEATGLLRDALTRYDWIDDQRFTRDVSNHAWLLAQHADDHPDFQALVLARMEPYASNGGIKKANYAYLWDRVAINTGRPQRYGTQPIWECDDSGALQLQPLEDPETVNERRKSMNMGSVEQDLKSMANNFCGAQRL